jgi:hypothetical protein
VSPAEVWLWVLGIAAAMVGVAFLILIQPPRSGDGGWEDPAVRYAADELGPTACVAADAVRRIADDEHRRAVR